jgi:hypothetical protein
MPVVSTISNTVFTMAFGLRNTLFGMWYSRTTHPVDGHPLKLIEMPAG